jgi:hypothetical protein
LALTEVNYGPRRELPVVPKKNCRHAPMLKYRRRECKRKMPGRAEEESVIRPFSNI